MTSDEPRRKRSLGSEVSGALRPRTPAPDGGDRNYVDDPYGTTAMIVTLTPAAHARPLFLGRLAAVYASWERTDEQADPDAA